MSGLGLYGGAGVEDADAGVNINVECCFVLYIVAKEIVFFFRIFFFLCIIRLPIPPHPTYSFAE